MSKLVVAEKPSVGQSIAAVLGATTRREGYLEGNGYIVSWCVGHLVELSEASAYDEKYGKWNREHLPILPDTWEYRVSEPTKKQFAILKKLMHLPAVESVISATDAGREGELIMRLVYEHAGCTKPLERLWISSMEESAIRKGFENLKPGDDFDSLYAAALCRAKADWLVGINGTRFFTTLYNHKLNIGRVMTPTLALITQREIEISSFEPTPFYTVQLALSQAENQFIVSGERLADKKEADTLMGSCKKEACATVENITSKERRKAAPALYDLTTLQREANRMYSYTAQQTLDYVQSLYEKKLCTYPRTDSRYLTSDMEQGLYSLVPAVYEKLLGMDGTDLEVSFGQVINDSKVTDHHAVIPTPSMLNIDLDALPSGERSILEMVSLRLLCAVSPAYAYLETSLDVRCRGHIFSAKTRTCKEFGWMEIEQLLYPDDDGADEVDLSVLSALSKGSTIPVSDASVKAGKTTAPKHFTEDTLLSAMETAGKEDAPSDAEHKGIGTPATRAGIIEKLVKIQLIERKKQKKITTLIPTAEGINLTAVLPESLQSPIMTAEWEHDLKRIELGEMEAETFMREIKSMVSELINTYEKPQNAERLFMPKDAVIGVCPRCGSPVTERKQGFFCSSNDCKFYLWKEHKFFSAKKKTITKNIASALLREGRAPLYGCYSAKTKKTYDAVAVLNDTGQYVNFSLEFPGKS